VVRAGTTNGDVVRTAPIEIAGVPDGVDIAPAGGPASAEALDVTAHVEAADLEWPESWYPPFAGPGQRVLVLTVHNRSDVTMSGLRVVGAVGRSKTDEAEPVSRSVDVLPARSTRTVRVPFTLSAPVWGVYVVSGSIYGLAAPVTFKVKTASEPWALELALPLALFGIAQMLRRRERARRRAEAGAEAEAEAALAAAWAPFPQSSPDVGLSDGAHWATSPYDQPHVVGADIDLGDDAHVEGELVRGGS
jgi:hypothetical protein